MPRPGLPAILAAFCLSIALGGCRLGTEQQAAKPPEKADPPAWKYREISLKGAGTDAFVLMYHDVVAKRGRGTLWYDSTPEEIQQNITDLKEWGATFVSMDDIWRALAEDKPLPPRAVAVTFDDNYQGFYDFAWPILKKEQAPVTMYVHTNYIGSRQGRPKMTLETLKALIKDPLFKVGSHTMSHPEDMKKLTDEQQKKEIEGSRAYLEKSLGVEVRDIAWPVGSYNAASIDLAVAAGYRSGVTMDSGPVWSSSSMMELRRYNPTKIKDAMQAVEACEGEPLGFTSFKWKDGPIHSQDGRFAGIPLALVRGGKPETVLVAGRESVMTLAQNFGAQAGINGGFFQIAAIASSDNRMIGPCLPSNVGQWFEDQDQARLMKLAQRPLVAMSGSGLILAPFRAAYNHEQTVKDMAGSVTDAFVAGAWLVHKGKARSRDQIMSAATADAMDPRRRAFLGVSAEGELILGACLGSYPSDKVAEAAVEAGCEEAVLLDSGFSTSLVIGDKILASGHSTKEQPSRPIPHAILVKGVLGEASSGAEGTPTPSVEPGEKKKQNRP